MRNLITNVNAFAAPNLLKPEQDAALATIEAWLRGGI
jgi:hypothetical protein